MKDEEKGIYLSVQTYLKGEALEAFYALVEQETKAWIASEHGQLIVKQAIAATIEEQIKRHFSWNFDKDPRADAFKKIVTDAMFTELLRQVPTMESPRDEEGTKT